MLAQNTSAIVLAAGYSSRMGCPKFSLPCNEKSTFLQHIIQGYEVFGCQEIIVVLNNDGHHWLEQNKSKFPKSVRAILNAHPELGRFYSLQCGIKKTNPSNGVFIHNVDNPFVEQEVLHTLVQNASDYDFVKPVYESRGGHPILLHHRIIPKILEADSENNKLNTFLGKFLMGRTKVNSSGILININTPEDLNEFQKKPFGF